MWNFFDFYTETYLRTVGLCIWYCDFAEVLSYLLDTSKVNDDLSYKLKGIISVP